jgi:hypothetical protein
MKPSEIKKPSVTLRVAASGTTLDDMLSGKIVHHLNIFLKHLLTGGWN